MRFPRLISLLVVLFLTAGFPALVAAEPVYRSVGHYKLVVRYASEPPYVEEKNALILEVQDTRTGRPVLGLERSLRIEGSVTILDVTRTYEMPLRHAAGRPEVYEGVFVPPALGRYAFHIYGSIEGTPVDEWFIAGSGGLPEVVPRTATDYSAPGVRLAFAIFAAYLFGLAVLLGRGFWQKRLTTQGKLEEH